MLNLWLLDQFCIRLKKSVALKAWKKSGKEKLKAGKKGRGNASAAFSSHWHVSLANFMLVAQARCGPAHSHRHDEVLSLWASEQDRGRQAPSAQRSGRHRHWKLDQKESVELHVCARAWLQRRKRLWAALAALGAFS